MKVLGLSICFSISVIVLLTDHTKPFRSVKIGTQIWMGENLNVSQFRNGDPIPEARTSEEWSRAEKNHSSAWCTYDNDQENGIKYGKLYNWYAVTDPRGLAPDGWHVPSDAEYSQLSDQLGGTKQAGGKMKEEGLATWFEPNTAASNTSGFHVLAGGGRRSRDGSFVHLGELATLWTSTGANDLESRHRRSKASQPHDPHKAYAWSRKLVNTSGALLRHDAHAGDGYSVRCLKND